MPPCKKNLTLYYCELNWYRYYIKQDILCLLTITNIYRGSVDKTFFSISRDHIISESCDSVGQFGASVVTNYYKLGQPLLQNRVAIKNWDKACYKLGQVLQIRADITNWAITTFRNMQNTYSWVPNRRGVWNKRRVRKIIKN